LLGGLGSLCLDWSPDRKGAGVMISSEDDSLSSSLSDLSTVVLGSENASLALSKSSLLSTGLIPATPVDSLLRTTSPSSEFCRVGREEEEGAPLRDDVRDRVFI
ncbi:hypothetical protein PMAYCL1PPCAC_06931, partial [Pristionchus mayeri]